MTPDLELLRQFARTNSEAAFAELVKRHVNLVYSAALRQVNGDAHLAQDVSQTVFTDLARKAGSLAVRETLTGWLYTSAHFAASKLVRGENRRRDREEKFMSEPAHETLTEPDWEKLQPVLDDAMHELKETDRDAILLRYFENQPFVQVGAKLGLNENAARMRVERALEKLRDILKKRGIATAAMLAPVISANAVQMAPANLAATLTTASIISSGTGTFTFMKIMTAIKLKLALCALVVAGTTAAFVIQHQAQEKLRADNTALTQHLALLQTDNESLSNRLADAGDSKKLTENPSNELLKLRGEVGVLRRQTGEANQEAQVAQEKLVAALSVQAQFTAHETGKINNMKELGLAMLLYANDNSGLFPTNLDQLANSLPQSLPNWDDFNSFDFMNAGVPNAHQKYPQMVVLRERLARQAPDGTWRRVYGFADGRVITATSYDGIFDAWEKVNAHSPPPN